MVKIGANDPYQQQILERKEIIEASHNATIQMAEILGQDANVQEISAQSGQHAAIPLSKAQQGLYQPIKLFLPNKETPKPEDFDSRSLRYVNKGQDDQVEVENYYSDAYKDELMNTPSSNEEEQEELITDILERRLAYIYMAFQPHEPIVGLADTLLIVRRSKTNNERVKIRAHSQVLNKEKFSFDELIGNKPHMVQIPADQEEEIGMQMSCSKKDEFSSHRTSMYKNLIDKLKKECDDKYMQDKSQYQREQVNQDTAKNSFISSPYINSNGDREESMIFSDKNVMKETSSNGELMLDADQKSQILMEPSQDQEKLGWTKELKPKSIETPETNQDKRRVNLTQSSQNERMDLGLENVIGNLQDSIKSSLVNQFLDASQDLFKLPRREHLPIDLKQSCEKFLTSINKFKYLNLMPPGEAHCAKFEIDGKSLESEFLGMVGRGSKKILSILNNIGSNKVERRASKVLLEKENLEDLEGIPRNEISAKVPRTSLERRKSQAYLENQQIRASFAPLVKLNNMPLLNPQDKRISPSFLERRQGKALVELAKKEEEQKEVEEINLQRRSSKAAIAAFAKHKRSSILENKTTKEINFGLTPCESIINLEQRRDSKAQRESDATQMQRQFGIARKSVHFKQTQAKTTNNQKRSLSLSTNQPLTLHHTRNEDKDEVMQFFEEESKDIYEASSSSSSEVLPPPLPKDVKFVIEKMHWTFDTLCALMEFIYTETFHSSCVELPDIYKAANEILLSSLTDAIRLKPINQYFTLAMLNDENRNSLLDLANQLTRSADFENYVNKNEDFRDLKKLCEAFEVDGPLEKQPYFLLLETGHLAFRNIPFVTQGLHTIEGQMVLILKVPREGTRLFEQNLEQNEYLTFQKKLSDQKNAPLSAKMHWLGQWPPIEKTKNREKAWKVYFFNFTDLKREIPLKNYIFYKYLNALTMRPIGKEEFNLRVVCGLLICPILYKALHMAFPQLDIVAGRGAGYFLGGETHGNNITLTGQPLYLLRACKALPRHLIGRTALRVLHPSEKTFVKLWMSTNRFGVDLEQGAMYFLKPLIQIQKILEHWHDLDMHANYVVTHPREIVELVEPHDPF